MFFAVIAWDKPGLSELRTKTKVQHAKHLDAGAPSLRVLQSGPLLSAEEKECGSLLVIEAETTSAVEVFLSRDPYVKAGLFASSAIHPWLWRRGNPYLSSLESRQTP